MIDPRADGAEFALSRVADRRGGIGVAVGLWLLAIGGLVAIAGFDRVTAGSPVGPSAPGSSGGGAALAGGTVAQASSAGQPNDVSSANIFLFDVRRDGNDLFVLGTALNPNVESIAMALRDETGRATEWTTVSVPGRSAPFRSGAAARFDAYIRIPDDLARLPTWVEASAYTADGRRLGVPRNVIVGAPPLVAEPSVVAATAFADLRVDATSGPEAPTRRIVRVDGRLVARAMSLTIRLETGEAVVDLATRDVSDKDGGVRPTSSPRFEVEFDLTALGVSGPVWVTLAAYDQDGIVVARVRRAVPVG